MHQPLTGDLCHLHECAREFTANTSVLNRWFLEQATERVKTWMEIGPALDRMDDDGGYIPPITRRYFTLHREWP